MEPHVTSQHGKDKMNAKLSTLLDDSELAACTVLGINLDSEIENRVTQIKLDAFASGLSTYIAQAKLIHDNDPSALTPILATITTAATPFVIQ